MPDAPEFNQQYVLHGRPEDGVQECFTPEVVALLLAEKDWTVEVWGGLLAVQRFRKHLVPDRYPAFVLRTLRLASLLRRALSEPEPPRPPLPPQEGIVPADPNS